MIDENCLWTRWTIILTCRANKIFLCFLDSDREHNLRTETQHLSQVTKHDTASPSQNRSFQVDGSKYLTQFNTDTECPVSPPSSVPSCRSARVSPGQPELWVTWARYRSHNLASEPPWHNPHDKLARIFAISDHKRFITYIPWETTKSIIQFKILNIEIKLFLLPVMLKWVDISRMIQIPLETFSYNNQSDTVDVGPDLVRYSKWNRGLQW